MRRAIQDPSNPLEHVEQEAVAKWRDDLLAMGNANPYPQLSRLNASASGEKRSKLIGWKLKRMGVLPGIPDFHLPVGRHGFLSLYVEMKRVKSGRLSETQKAMCADLVSEGNMVVIARGAKDAIDQIERYLSGPMTKATI